MSNVQELKDRIIELENANAMLIKDSENTQHKLNVTLKALSDLLKQEDN